MRPQQPTSCTPSFSLFRVIVTLIPVMLSTAPVCGHGVVRSSCNAHCPESLSCHDREDVRHASGWCVCATRRSVTQIATVEMSPLSSAFFVLRESADLDSQCTYKCTGSWTGARCNRFSLSTSRAVPVYGLASTSPVQNNTSSCSTSAKGTVEADLKFELPP